MKVLICFLALALIGVADAQRSKDRDKDGAIDRACTVTDCFNERDIRDFEVIDQQSLIVYVGPQHCAFRVDVRGTLCDMTFAPELYFSKVNDPNNVILPTEDRSLPDAFNPLAMQRRDRRDIRICANDLSVQVDGGRFTEPLESNQPTDRFGNTRSECVVAGVWSLTDDQLMELYVERDIAPPPPPMGTGEIEVGEQEAAQEAAAPEREQDDLETGEQ